MSLQCAYAMMNPTQDEEEVDPNPAEFEDTDKAVSVIGLCQDEGDMAQDNADGRNAASRFNACKPVHTLLGPLSRLRP